MGLEEIRDVIEAMKQQGVSERRACEAVGMARSSARYEPVPLNPQEERMIHRMRELALRFYRYGYRRIAQKLLEDLPEQDPINPKRVYRLYRLERLQLPRRRPRKRRLHALLAQRPQLAQRINDVWSFDFLFDRTVTGRALKIFAMVDEHSRESLEIRVGHRFRALEVRSVLEAAISRYGKPRYVRCDNGPEFISGDLRQWLSEHGIRPLYIDPGSPWQNGFIESFNGKFRDECLNAELFWSQEEAQMVVNSWRHEYNTVRPHMSLEYKTPAQVGQRPVDPSEAWKN
jgi:putative transposase